MAQERHSDNINHFAPAYPGAIYSADEATEIRSIFQNVEKALPRRVLDYVAGNVEPNLTGDIVRIKLSIEKMNDIFTNNVELDKAIIFLDMASESITSISDHTSVAV
ncbi:hypothetical protein SAMN02982994_6379 [Azospirillum lipoferum]|nr:hypothetical protein SAMN02982994_6379 [Azospirillum lipoferum]